MGLRSRLIELTALEHVDNFLAKHPVCAFFKAGSCHKTMQGFGYVEEALNKREELPLAFVRVVENRPVSNYIAEITHVTHQSPQFILMVDGKAVYDVDNWYIVPEALEEALDAHLGPVKSQLPENKPVKQTDASSYINLLRQYVSGNVGEEKFKFQWLAMFQMDSELRSTQEFDLLNSLFGDVDRAIEEEVIYHARDPSSESQIKPPAPGGLKAKAEKLLDELEQHFSLG